MLELRRVLIIVIAVSGSFRDRLILRNVAIRAENDEIDSVRTFWRRLQTRRRLLCRSGYSRNAIRPFVFPSEQMSNSGSGNRQIWQ